MSEEISSTIVTPELTEAGRHANAMMQSLYFLADHYRKDAEMAHKLNGRSHYSLDEVRKFDERYGITSPGSLSDYSTLYERLYDRASGFHQANTLMITIANTVRALTNPKMEREDIKRILEENIFRERIAAKSLDIVAELETAKNFLTQEGKDSGKPFVYYFGREPNSPEMGAVTSIDTILIPAIKTLGEGTVPAEKLKAALQTKLETMEPNRAADFKSGDTFSEIARSSPPDNQIKL
jgi:hypothetical protein